LRITGATRGHILLWDKGQRKLSLEVSRGIPEREQAYVEAQLAQEASFTDWIMQHRQAALIHDLARDPAAGWYLPTSIDTRAALVAPVLQDLFVIGVISLENTQAGAFSQDDLRLVENLAIYAGMAVQNAIRYDEIQQNSILREGLLKAGQSITALQEPEAVLQAIADSAREALACDVVTLYTYKQDIEEIGFPAVISGELRSPDRLQEIRNIRKESVVGQLVAAGRPHFADDSFHDAMMTAGAFVQRESIRSSAGIPLRVGDETLGILFVNFRTPHSFSPSERSAVELFATQAAITIYNANLFKSVQRQSRHREALCEASKAITARFAWEQRQVLDRIVEQAVERITGVDGPKATWGTIQLYDPVTQELVFENVYPPGAMSLVKGQLGDRLRLDGTKTPGGRIGITGRVVAERKSQRVKDVHQDPDYVEYDPASRSELAVPLWDGDEVVGVLSVESDQLGAFDEGDEEALKGLAELAVIAIKNAEQARQLGRTNAFAAMGAWGAEIAHEVNREVGNIRLVVSSLKRRSDLAPEVIEYLKEIDSYAGKLGLPALPEHAPQPGQVIEFKDAPLLDQVIEEAIEAAGQEPEQKSYISIESDLKCEGIRVAMHPYWLSRLTHHLVRNAIRSTPLKERGNRITVRTRVQDTLAEIAVEDTGLGVPPDKIPLLFNQPVPTADGHHGRGLLVVSYIAEVYGGSARLVWNRAGEGACFAFYVPLAQPTDRKRGK
jgi:GAF domain-containing protein